MTKETIKRLFKKNKESIQTMLASEKVLKTDWNNKIDKKWDKLK